MRLEVVQRYHSDNGRRQRGRNLRIAHVGKVLHALHIQMMNFCVEGRSHFTRRPGKIDQQPVLIHHIDREPMRFQPSRDRVEILRRQPESLSVFLRGEPLMKVRRGRILKFINVLAELLLLFRRPLQLEQHVIHRKVVSDQPAIVLLVRLRPGVSREGDQLAFVHILRNQNRTAILGLRREADEEGKRSQNRQKQEAR